MRIQLGIFAIGLAFLGCAESVKLDQRKKADENQQDEELSLLTGNLKGNSHFSSPDGQCLVKPLTDKAAECMGLTLNQFGNLEGNSNKQSTNNCFTGAIRKLDQTCRTENALASIDIRYTGTHNQQLKVKNWSASNHQACIMRIAAYGAFTRKTWRDIWGEVYRNAHLSREYCAARAKAYQKWIFQDENRCKDYTGRSNCIRRKNRYMIYGYHISGGNFETPQYPVFAGEKESNMNQYPQIMLVPID